MCRFGWKINWLAANRLFLSLVILVGVAAVEAAPPSSGTRQTTATTTRPNWDDIVAAVQRHFAAYPGYQPRDIISRSQVESLLVSLKKLGWTVPQAAQTLSRAPGDSDFIVVRLRSNDGRRFMRKISSDPMAYVRVDGLSKIYDGRRVVNDLISGPGGERMIEYLATNPGGAGLTQQLQDVPGGANFGIPTGKIYTAEALLADLSRQYKAEQGSR